MSFCWLVVVSESQFMVVCVGGGGGGGVCSYTRICVCSG